jgi:retron-type reverse transcriptase
MILQKKIQDQRFLNLIWKLLNAGYMDLHGVKKGSLIGSPQSSLVSPILANVYGRLFGRMGTVAWMRP